MHSLHKSPACLNHVGCSIALHIDGQDLADLLSNAQEPLVMETGRAVKANLSLDAGLLAAIDEAAEARGLTDRLCYRAPLATRSELKADG